MSLPVADCHNDLLMSVRHLRERGHEDPFGDFWLPQLRAGDVRLQVLPVYTEEQFVGEGALRRAMLMLEEARHLAAVHDADVVIVETARELEDALASDRIALLLAFEGAEPIGSSLELIDSFWRAGVRMASLSWNRRTMMADGVAETDTGGRLTRLGVEAIERMEQLGMIVDVSHLSRAGFFHLAEVVTRPFIASHSSCAELRDHPRNLDDEQLTVIRDTRSMLCLNAFGPFLADDPDVEAFLSHVEHALDRVGFSGVGLGADFIDDVFRVVDPISTGMLVPFDEIPPTLGLVRPADFGPFTTRLEQRFGDAIARSVAAGNLTRFLRSALP